MKAFTTLIKTELKLSVRGMDMIIFAICLPVAVMVILGFIYGGNSENLAVSFSAVSTIAICAGGVMGLPLVISGYRQNKILKRFKVTPVSPALLLFVQVMIYTVYSVVSLISVYLVASIFFGFHLPGSWFQFIGAFALVMISMFSIGTLVGGVSPNTKSTSIIASILYFPMLIFSGATLPYEIMPAQLQKIADVLPLTQGIKILKAAALDKPIENITLSLTIICTVAIVCTMLSVKFFKWE
ncbi:MAG: ABC transporter permease [Eubacteriales bacterium]